MIADCQLSVGQGETFDEEGIFGAPSECWVQCPVRAQRQDGLQLQEAHALKTTAHADNREARRRGGREKAPWEVKGG